MPWLSASVHTYTLPPAPAHQFGWAELLHQGVPGGQVTDPQQSRNQIVVWEQQYDQ